MKFLKKFSDHTYLIKLNVKPNSKTRKIINNDEFLTILLSSKPIQNKANKELINYIKNKLKIPSNQIKIVSGLQDSNKVIKIDFLEKIIEEELIQRLLD